MPRHSGNAFSDHDACGVGFIAQLGGSSSRDVVERALTALLRLSHRGGVDADGSSGDGAGLLTPIPEEFIRDRAGQAGIELRETFGLGMVFLPREQETQARAAIEASAEKTGLRCLGWRIVPTDPFILGPRAAATLPAIRQCFFAAEDQAKPLERRLYLLRKRVEAEGPRGAYFCSLSSRTVVYKGLLAPRQLPAFYPLITQDRPGLLYQVSSAIAGLGCNIEVALIDTEGQKVIHVFYLTARGAKLDSARQQALREALLRFL